MSNQNSPSRDTVSPSNSSTFYSINDSDFDNMNLSNAADVSVNNLFGASKTGDETLTNISQTTLNFLLDEKQQSGAQQTPIVADRPTPVPRTTPQSDTTTTTTSTPVVTPAKPLVTPGTPVVTPPTPQILSDLENANESALDGPKPTAVSAGQPSAHPAASVQPAVVAKAAAPVPPPTPVLETTIISLDDDDSDANDTAVIELSSDDDNTSERDQLTSHTLTDESLDSRAGSLLPENGDDATTTTAATTTTSTDLVNVPLYKTVAEFERNLPPTVTLLQAPDGAKVYLVGTAHFSRESMDDVSLVIRNVRPDVVMVELCPSRIHILKHDEKTLLEEASNINLAHIRQIVRQNGLINGLFYIVLLKMSAKLTQELGMAPGGEFRRALEEVHRLENCILHLGDRPINITLQRALHGLSMWQTLKIVWKLVSSDEKISKEDVEKCKQADMLEELMNEMAGEYPEFRTVFVTERDLYLCHSLQVAATQHMTCNGPVKPATVVGVVGIGHMAGITQHWGKVNADRIPEITTIPQPSKRSRVIKFAVKWTILGAIGYGVYRVVGPRLPAKLPW